MADRIGQQIGNYRLVKLLGRGGFAEVYLGEHIYLKRPAAIKVLHTMMTKEDLVDFADEARTIAQLNHPNIVRIIDFGVDSAEDMPYLVMEYAPNGTLRQRHPKKSKVPLTDVVSYVKQVAAALQYAHDAKLIHRDVKPENMLLGSTNEVLLSDFGIAAIAHSTYSLKPQKFSGTVQYSAPEQINNLPVPASDQYSLGIIVYEWLSGSLPFTGTTLTQIAMKHMNEPPQPLRERVSGIPVAVDYVVMQTLAKDPRDRYPSVQKFAEDLERAASKPAKVSPAVNPIPPTIPANSPVSPAPAPNSGGQQLGHIPPQPVVNHPRLPLGVEIVLWIILGFVIAFVTDFGSWYFFYVYLHINSTAVNVIEVILAFGVVGIIFVFAHRRWP